MTTGTLSAVAVKNAKAKEQPYKLSDGGGMFLLVDAKGGKYWRLAYRFLGKQKTLALGVYPQGAVARRCRPRNGSQGGQVASAPSRPKQL